MKQFIENLKNWMKEFLSDDENKRYLKIFGIWYYVAVLIGMTFVMLDHLHPLGLKEILSGFVFVLLCPFVVFLVFAPAFWILKFLFGKTQNIVARMVLTAVLIPVTNMIYFLVGYYFPILEEIASIAMIIGFFAIFWLVPTAFFVTLFIPKKLLPKKFICAGTLALTEVFGYVLAAYLMQTYMKVVD